MSNTQNFEIDSSKRSCLVDLHVVIAMGYTALYQIKANCSQIEEKKMVLCGLECRYFGNEKILGLSKLFYWQGFYKHFK